MSRAKPPLSAATALAGVVLALTAVAYASLYPFEGWRENPPGVSEWLLSPWPKYWTAADLWVNWLGYVPFGAALTLWLSRLNRGWGRAAIAVALASLVSLGLESVQSMMVHRVASNVDWTLNTLGAACGVGMAHVTLASSALHAWGRWRQAYFAPGAGLVLLVMGLWLLLLPLPMLLPFAVGRLPPDASLALLELWAQWGADTLSVRLPVDWSRLSLGVQAAGLTLLVLTPLSLMRFVWQQAASRVWAAWSFLGLLVLVPTLSHMFNYGWAHAGDWLLPPVTWALAAAGISAPLVMCLPRLGVVWLSVMMLVAQYIGVNALAETGYWAFHWAAFEQGRFVRWYGLLAWVAVIWPLLAIAMLLRVQFKSHDSRG